MLTNTHTPPSHFTTQESPSPTETLRCEKLPTTHDENSTTLPTDDEDQRSWSAFTTSTEPDKEDLLTLPPHCSHWLDIELNKQLRELEKDVAELLVEDHRDTTHHDDIIELTSLPRNQWLTDFTPLYETAARTGKSVTTWSRDDFDLYTWEGLQDALYELQQNPPSHLWISLPWDHYASRTTTSDIGEDG